MDAWKNSICKVYPCSNYASREIDLLPICPEHAWELAQHFRPVLTQEAQIEARKLAKHAKEVRARQTGNGEPPVVYYARIGDYIKIGYTTKLRDRLNTLRVDELLAIEPGGPELERERHHQFLAERIDLRRENFRQSNALAEHILGLLVRHPLPHWASLPRTTTITRRTEGTA